MKKTILSFITATSLLACSPFSKISKDTKIGAEEAYVNVYNTTANFRSQTYGDFKFATSQQQFSRLHPAKPSFRDILFYAKTNQPEYDYYVLYNPRKKVLDNQGYILKDTIIGTSKFVLAISKKAPKEDIAYIMGNMASE